MGKELGQQVIIDNKPGAGTIIGTDNVAKSPADGYSIVIATFAHAVNPSMVPKLPYNAEKAFAPITLIGKGPNVLVVRADSPIKSVKDLLAAAKAKPGKLNYASQGQRHVRAPGRRDVHQPRQAGDDPRALPRRRPGDHRPAGRPGGHDLRHGSRGVDLRRQRQAARHRRHHATPSDAFKGVPPIAQDVPGYQVESWYGLYAPAGTPADVIAKLSAAAKKAAHSPEFSKKIEQEGLSVVASDPAELDRYVKAEEARWRKIVKENNIKPD